MDGNPQPVRQKLGWDLSSKTACREDHTHYPADTERRSLDNSRDNPTREPPVEKTINYQTTGLPFSRTESAS